MRTPTFSGDLNTEACGDGGERFVPTAVDVQMENLVTTCDDTFSQGFVYTPSDTSCRNETPPRADACRSAATGSTTTVTG